MTAKTFIEYFQRTISQEGQILIGEFFITFSRFECALKASGFVNGNMDKVSANWDAFLGSVVFDPNRTVELKETVDYLIQNPPRIQALDNGQLIWRDRVFQQNEPVVNKLGISIRDIRNNLFHGGKFNGNYQEDVSRNYILLKHSIVILNEWLSQSAAVSANFLMPIA